MNTSELWIGGKEHKPSSGEYFDDLNPSNGDLIASVAKGNSADINTAVADAKKTFQHFKDSEVREREKILCDAASIVERDRDVYMELLINEVGSPQMKAAFEVEYCINAFRAAAGVPRRLAGQTMPLDRPGAFGMSVREPVGVIGCITPFNVPLLKNVKQIAMVIATGNTAVLMPSEFAPQVTVQFAKTLHEAGLPGGVFNYVTGDPAEIGDYLTSHDDIAAINFCGSPRVGQHVASIAAKSLKPMTLELGGKNPLIILDDADLDKALEAAMLGIFFFQGQACMASSRIIVQSKELSVSSRHSSKLPRESKLVTCPTRKLQLAPSSARDKLTGLSRMWRMRWKKAQRSYMAAIGSATAALPQYCQTSTVT